MTEQDGSPVTPDPLVEFLEARLAEREASAKAVRRHPGPWMHEAHSGLLPAARDVFDASGEPIAIANGGYLADHVVMHVPEQVLRDVESTRLLVAEILAMPHDYNEEDPWYSCSQAVSSWNGDPEPGSGCVDDERSGKPCDCGRDSTVKRMLGIIVLRWSDHPDYRTEWKP